MCWLGTFTYFRIETIYRRPPSRVPDARNRLRGGRPRGNRLRVPDRPGDGDLGASDGPPPELRPRGAVGDGARIEVVHRPRGPVRPSPRRPRVPGARPAGRDRASGEGRNRGVAPRGEPRPAPGGRAVHELGGLPRLPARASVPEPGGRHPRDCGPPRRVPHAPVPPPRAGPREREGEE